MFLYKIEEFTDHIKELSEFILQASIDLEKAIKELKNLKNIRVIADSCIRINSVENRADFVFDRAVADLFLYETDAIRIYKIQGNIRFIRESHGYVRRRGKRNGIYSGKKRLI